MATYLMHYGVKGMKWGVRRKNQYTLDSAYEKQPQSHNGQAMRKSNAGTSLVRQNMRLGVAASRGQITRKNPWNSTISEIQRNARYTRRKNAAANTLKKVGPTKIRNIKAGKNNKPRSTGKRYQPNRAKQVGIKNFNYR